MRNIVETLLDHAERGLERVRWLAAEADLAQHLPRWTDAAIRVCLAAGVGGGRVTDSLERAADKLERALGDEGWTALQDMRCERDALEFERDCALERVEVLEALLQSEAVLPRSHPGARRVGVRRTGDGGVAVRTVDDDGVTPIGPSVYFREAALRAFLGALAVHDGAGATLAADLRDWADAGPDLDLDHAIDLLRKAADFIDPPSEA